MPPTDTGAFGATCQHWGIRCHPPTLAFRSPLGRRRATDTRGIRCHPPTPWHWCHPPTPGRSVPPTNTGAAVHGPVTTTACRRYARTKAGASAPDPPTIPLASWRDAGESRTMGQILHDRSGLLVFGRRNRAPPISTESDRRPAPASLQDAFAGGYLSPGLEAPGFGRRPLQGHPGDRPTK